MGLLMKKRCRKMVQRVNMWQRYILNPSSIVPSSVYGMLVGRLSTESLPLGHRLTVTTGPVHVFRLCHPWMPGHAMDARRPSTCMAIHASATQKSESLEVSETSQKKQSQDWKQLGLDFLESLGWRPRPNPGMKIFMSRLGANKTLTQ